MAREQLELARDLIKQKRYQDAERLLRTIDHPTAEKWLGQLQPYLAKPATTSKYSRSLWIVLGVIMFIIAAFVVWSQFHGADQTETARLKANVAVSCQLETDDQFGCQQWADRVLQVDRQAVEACTTLYTLSSQVMDCLQDRGYRP